MFRYIRIKFQNLTTDRSNTEIKSVKDPSFPPLKQRSGRLTLPTFKLSVDRWLQPLRSIKISADQWLLALRSMLIPLDRLLLAFRSKQTTLDPYLQPFKHYRQQKYFYQLP